MNVVLSLLAVASMAMSGPEPQQADIAWVVQGDFCEPETVLALPDESLLVSNVCDFRTAGDGFLSLLDAQGQVLDWRIVEGLDSPLGMAMHDDKLYIIDNNRLKLFTWPDYELLETIVLDSTVANDLAVAADGTVYVTDTAKHRVIRVLPDRSQSIFTGKAQFKGANGAAVSGSHLYIGGERLWRVDLDSLSVETVGPQWLADIDGIELESDGTLQLTPVGGPLIRYRGDDDIEVITGPGVSSANHGFAASLGLVLIPTGYDNTVIAIRLPGTAPGFSSMVPDSYFSWRSVMPTARPAWSDGQSPSMVRSSCSLPVTTACTALRKCGPWAPLNGGLTQTWSILWSSSDSTFINRSDWQQV